MRWTVVSVDNSEAELTEIYLRATDKRAITLAANRIEEVLRLDPETAGEDFYGDRIYLERPLAVVFQVVPDDRLVRIIQFLLIKN